MLETILKQGDWSLLCDPKFKSTYSGVGDLSNLIAQLHEFPVTLKNNHRSTVKRGRLFELDVVGKRPTDKNRRIWARISSLLRAGESVTTIQNLAKLESAGIESVKPMFALERRKYGMIVDSWMCYQYRDGEPCDVSGLARVVDMLNDMHEAKFQHGDPTWNNFLLDESNVLFTIDTKAKPCRGAFDATNDFLLLRKANKLPDLDIDTLGRLNRSAVGYWLAVTYMNIKSFRSLLKSKIKKNRPKNL